jgi:hypothetical protein
MPDEAGMARSCSSLLCGLSKIFARGAVTGRASASALVLAIFAQAQPILSLGEGRWFCYGELN